MFVDTKNMCELFALNQYACKKKNVNTASTRNTTSYALTQHVHVVASQPDKSSISYGLCQVFFIIIIVLFLYYEASLGSIYIYVVCFVF